MFSKNSIVDVGIMRRGCPRTSTNRGNALGTTDVLIGVFEPVLMYQHDPEYCYKDVPPTPLAIMLECIDAAKVRKQACAAPSPVPYASY